MATFLVINTDDSGSGSLRDAIDAANANPDADKIEFAPWLSGSEINLQSTLTISSGTLTINGDIDGDGSPDITISGDQDDNGADTGDLRNLLTVTAQSEVTLNALHFTGAYFASYQQGLEAAVGIHNAGILTIKDSILSDMIAVGAHGSSINSDYVSGHDGTAGIVNFGTLTISDTMFDEMRASGGDGNVYANLVYGHGGRATAGIRNNGTVYASGIGISNAYVRDGGGTVSGIGGDAIAGIQTTGLFSTANVTGPVAVYNNTFGYGSGSNGDHLEGGIYGSGIVALAMPSMSNGGQLAYVGFMGTYFGFGGNDLINNGPPDGYGKLYGQGGNDTIITYGYGARAYGGSGNDIIRNVGMLASTMDGGSGVDLFDLAGNFSGLNFTLNMATGVSNIGTVRNFENVLGENNASRSDNIRGTDGANVIAGRDGDDILKGLGGNDQILGGKGDDDIRGGDANDILRGGNNTDTLRGDNGSDIVHGGSGADFLFGGNANDRLRGGDGSDELQGDKGNDVLRGGGGKDTFIFGKGFDKDSVRDFTDNTDQIALNDNLWKGTLSKTQILNQFATLKGNGDVVFDFGNGDIFTIKDAGSVAIFKNDMVIV
ncbi:MAG: hypothetical protein KDJ19_05090 [Hyphomicrobiaceae bacterium]|nr:hypothetical protein [Hyphomicrobiaceae bacterium]MCC0024898.1 hypothetical protein [Hyphomicrobiaceae bacterium]